MTTWHPVFGWKTNNDVEYEIEQAYDRRRETWELRLSLRAGETWFVRDRWDIPERL